MRTSSKRFVLSTEAMNSQGFRVRTAGIDLSQFEKNPIMLWQHQHPQGLSKEEILPLGNFINLQVDQDGKLTGQPVFDDTDDFALKIYNKFENGTIRMMSASLMPKTWKMVAGEKWLWESTLVEATATHRGSNPEALPVQLYNEKQELIELSEDYFKDLTKTNTDMKLIELNPADAAKMVKLSGEATAEQFTAEVGKLVTLTETQAAELVTLKADKDAAEAAKTAAETAKAEADAALQTLKAEQEKGKLVQLVADGKAVGKFLPEMEEVFLGNEEKKIVAMSYDQAKMIIDKMPANKSLEAVLKLKAAGADAELLTLSWKELEAKDGALVTLAKGNPEAFKAKYKAHFKKDYVGNLVNA